MGFDLKRFIGEVDQEFECSICTMVLENPLQTPCDHLFCSECINNWLSVKKSCPVDSKPLAITDLKPLNRSFRNLLNKFEIKCDFDSQGCNEIVKLENLQDHIASCEYNPDAQIACDKGCNLEMSRREYQTSNCFAHLSINHKKEIAALMQELSNQKEHFDRLVHRQAEENEKLSNELSQFRGRQDQLQSVMNRQGEAIERLTNEVMQLRREKDQLEGVTSRQEREIKTLSEVLHQLRHKQNEFEASMKRQEKEVGHFKERTEFLLAAMKWELSENIKSPFRQPDVLETIDKSKEGSVRSFYALEPKNSSFKVEVMSAGHFYVGLSFKGETNTQLSKWFAYYSDYLYINNVFEFTGPKCKIGDIIELGIKFPLNFVNDGKTSVELYLSINERVVKEKLVKMPNDAIYPAIEIRGKDAKIKYFGI